MDESFLDTKYFIDDDVYNCPFCNRRHVSYVVSEHWSFDWTREKKCYGYCVRCLSCNCESMHLSFAEIKVKNIVVRADILGQRFAGKHGELDDLFFYSVPTSFFVLDKRIPKVLRELVTEAEGCLKSNFLTGASACARKVVYELARIEKASGQNYEERIKSLKKLRSDIEPTYFDTLLTIHETTSSKVHELSYDGWDSKHLRLILSTLCEILGEIYVIPALRQEKRKAILELKGEVLGGKDGGKNGGGGAEEGEV